MADRENTVPESLVHLEARMAELEQQGFRPSAWAHELEGALEGAVFPLSREELILVARENETGRTLLTLLHGIPGGEYHSQGEVLEALEQVPGGEIGTK